MHSAEIVVDNEEWTCHFNGDLSGDVWVDVSASRIPVLKGLLPDLDTDIKVIVKIPFEIMKELVGRYLISEQISRLEQMYGKNYIDRLKGAK